MNEETPVTNDVSLDDFEAEFFGQTSSTDAAATAEEVKDESESDAPINAEVDTQDVDDTHDEGEDDNSDEDGEQAEEIADEPKPKKNRFQERIDELTAKAREAERREAATLSKLEEIMAKLEQQDTNDYSDDEPDVGPQPDDLNEDGTEKYPLGEYDPNYIKDQVKFTLEQEREALRQREEEEANQREIDQARLELQNSWNENLVSARERYPDFQEKAEAIVNEFSGLNEAYGEYLSTTIMSMEYGSDVLYYLANNPDEARKIVNSGATKATVALGRLEAKFAFAAEEKAKARPKVSNAPAPPPVQNKGSAPVGREIRGDEDDLDLISKALFAKK